MTYFAENKVVTQVLDDRARELLQDPYVYHRHVSTAFFKLFYRYARAEFLWYFKGGDMNDYL